MHIDETNVVNVIIAKNFNLTDEEIQVQLLQVGLTIFVMEDNDTLTTVAVDASRQIDHRSG